ncbi:S8 family serine peptidase [Kribbella sp. DT2]|uniref:S8 family serine peptidase n=1 Tax=Kribbella sp. DT2 TaxID=3393427 RepID=UPI003CE9EAAD
MRRNHRRTTALLAGAVVLSLVGSIPPAFGKPIAPPATDPGRTVTLLTGDTVEVGKDKQLTPRPGPGRQGISFTTERLDDHLYVVPSDADELLRQGKLDRRLFDVNELLADARGKSVELIVQYDATSRQARPLRSLNAAPVAVAKDEAGTFWAGIATADRQLTGGVEKVWLDGERKLSLDQSVAQIGAPQAWQAGFTGQGTKVAVLDSGVDATHQDLAGQVAAARNFTDEDATDQIGHGTHVASTIAGTGSASGGKYKGVAPDAKLLDGKVCAAYGCSDSAILAGMEWAAVEQGADVVNLSLGGDDTPEIDLVEAGINRLSAETGALFVVAAGNHPTCTPNFGVNSPATADAALAVGAVDKSDQLAGFSCTGPRTGDHAIKPDITAPGVDIVAARAAGTTAGTPVDENYTRLNGTSMATPHVAGSAAILAQQHPEWTSEQLKSTLMAASKPNPALTVFQQGAGRVDVAAAVRQTVVTPQQSLSFPVQVWPHSDDAPVTRTVTYQNSGTADVQLALSVTGTGPDGKPSGTFTVSPSSVNVPAGRTAQVTVTSNTAQEGPDGFHTGRLTATGTGVQLTTALAVEKEAESYDVTIKHLDRQGHPIAPMRTVVSSVGEVPAQFVTGQPTEVLRLPKGRYTLSSFLRGADAQGDEDKVLLAMPELLVDKATTVSFEMAKAEPIKVTVPEPGATPAMITVNYEYRDNLSSGYYGGGSFEGLSTAQVGPAVAGRKFASSLTTQWCRADGPGCAADSPYMYYLRWYVKGRLFTGFDKAVRKQDLATLNTRFAGQASGEISYAALPVDDIPADNGNLGGWPTLPSKVTEYFQPDGIRWLRQFRDYDQEPQEMVTRIELGTSPRVFQAGTTTDESWGLGVLGPGLPATDRRPFDPVARPWASRTGAQLSVGLPLFTDQAGHPGFSRTDSARTTLTRNGQLVAEADTAGALEASLPAGDASYRLEATANRESLNAVSSKVTAAWTFRSGHTGRQVALPLSAIRFTPVLDLDNRAAAVPAWVPVTVERQPGSAAKPAAGLTVDVSYDEGSTWKPAPLKPAGAGKWLVQVTPPANGSVSFRSSSTDQAGNKVEQTIIRAYRTR